MDPRFGVRGRRSFAALPAVRALALAACDPPSDAPLPDGAPPADPRDGAVERRDGTVGPRDGGVIARDSGPRPDTGPPPPPGCGIESAAFCDDFEAGPSGGRRTGELDPARWTVGRMEPQLSSMNEGAFWIGPSDPVPDCRAGLDGSVLDVAHDSVICDGSPGIETRHALLTSAPQDYGLNSYRIAQPFDLRGRTGTIAFDAELRAQGLFGWLAVVVQADPALAPSLALEHGVGPREGVASHFLDCDATSVAPQIFVFRDHVEQAGARRSCIPVQRHRPNHVEVRVSEDRVVVVASEPSADGRTFGATRELLAADVAMSFDLGYVSLAVHNHATRKYGYGDAWDMRYEDVGQPPEGYAIRVRLNGGPWHEDEVDGGLLEAAAPSAVYAAVPHVFDIPLAELRDGDNTLEVIAMDVPSGYPPAIANVDLVLRDDP